MEREKKKRRKIYGMDRHEWAMEIQGYTNYSDYSTKSESIYDEDSVMEFKFNGEWETFKRSQRG